MISPPIVAPQTAPRRGPRQASAAQQNFLANRAGAQPVTPTPPSGKPNQFSASGPGSQPSPSSGAGSSASGVSSIPAASSGGASSTPASLGQVPSGSGMMKRGGRVQNFAAGGATETNQYGSWGGANAADAATGTPNSYSNVAPQPSGISNTQGPFSTTPSPYSATFNPGGGSTPATPTGQLSNGAGGFVAGNVGGVMTGNGEGVGYNNGPAINPQVNNQSNYKGQGHGSSPLSAGDQLNVSNYSQGMAAARGGSIPAPKEEPYRNKWKAKNHAGDNAYKFDDGGDVPDPGGAVPTDPTDPSEMQDTGQGQSGQAGDLGGALSAVQNAYKYGMSLLTGNIGANSQVQASGPPVNGQPSWSEEDQANLDSTNNTLTGMFSGNPNIRTPIGAPPIGPGTVTGGIQGAKMIGGAFGNAMSTPAQAGYTAFQARGGSVPSYQDGGIAVPPAAPQPQQQDPAPTGGGVGGAPPPQIMRYLTGADAAPVPQVMQHMKSLSGHGRAARTVAAGKTPQQQYAIMQALRRLSDAASTHAKVSLHGNGRIPASLPHAVMFANKKFEYAPSPLHIQFGLKGQKPAQRAASGGGIQDPGEFGPGSVGDQNYAMQDQQITGDQADASDPNKGGFGPGSRLDKEYASQNAALGGGIQSFDDGGDVSAEGDTDNGPNPATNTQGSDPISQMADAGAPITMNVSDLQSGQNTSMDITPQQLENTILGQRYDDIIQKGQASQGDIGDRIAKFFPGLVSTTRTGGAQYSPPGEGDINAQTQPDWSTLRQTGLPGGQGNLNTLVGQPSPDEAIQMGNDATTGISGVGSGQQPGLGEHGEAGTTTAPGQPSPGEARGMAANQNWGPIDTTPDKGIQMWNAQTGKWEDSTLEEFDAIRGKDPNAPVRIPDPANPDSWKTVTTGYVNQNFRALQNPGPRENAPVTGGQPDVTYGAEDRTTTPVDAEGPTTNAPVKVVRGMPPAYPGFAPETIEGNFGVNPVSPIQRGPTEPAPRRIGGNEGTPQRAARPARAVSRNRPHPMRRRHGAIDTGQQAAAQGGSIQARPRRVYGHGHRGLGTYQEMPDGQAQYLGPHNLTG